MTSFTDKDGEAGNDSFSWFSNYLPAYSLSAADARRRRIVAAPGDSIISTYPIDRLPTKSLPQGYHSMSGTSMVRWWCWGKGVAWVCAGGNHEGGAALGAGACVAPVLGSAQRPRRLPCAW